MKLVMLFLIVLFLPFTMVVAQSKQVGMSTSLDLNGFLEDNNVKTLMKLNGDFKFNIDFKRQYDNEIVFYSESRSESIFIIKWDDLIMSIYHESIRGRPLFKNKIIELDSTTETYKSFLDLTKKVYPSFYKQMTREDIKYYTSQFLIFRRNGISDLNWGMLAMNGREFKDDSNYPNFKFESLIDFILLEFGGMP